MSKKFNFLERYNKRFPIKKSEGDPLGRINNLNEWDDPEVVEAGYSLIDSVFAVSAVIRYRQTRPYDENLEIEHVEMTTEQYLRTIGGDLLDGPVDWYSLRYELQDCGHGIKTPLPVGLMVETPDAHVEIEFALWWSTEIPKDDLRYYCAKLTQARKSHERKIVAWYCDPHHRASGTRRSEFFDEAHGGELEPYFNATSPTSYVGAATDAWGGLGWCITPEWRNMRQDARIQWTSYTVKFEPVTLPGPGEPTLDGAQIWLMTDVDYNMITGDGPVVGNTRFDVDICDTLRARQDRLISDVLQVLARG